jgi:hypothetical protein
LDEFIQVTHIEEGTSTLSFMSKQEVIETRELLYKEEMRETITKNVSATEEEITEAVEENVKEEEFQKKVQEIK